MNHPQPTPAPTATGGHRAVQQDLTVTGVDWPVCHAWTAGDPDFTGEVTVFGTADTQLACTPWRTPTDAGADESLHRIGWHRTGPWVPDWTGRRTAPVTPMPVTPLPVHPGSRVAVPATTSPAGTVEP